jgi:hypothetical protein
MTTKLASLAVSLAVVAGSAMAGPEAPRAVVELFTSQGCSSCPPADRIMADIARDPELIGLSLPVDYWDYLGWKDTMAKPMFSDRQRAYASARGDRQVYTPQVVVNGVVPCLGSNRAEIDRAVASSPAGASRPELPVAVKVSETSTAVMVELGAAAADGPKAAELWVVPVTRSREVAIGRGENKGRTLTYANVARGLAKVGDWTGAPAQVEVPLRTARPGDADSYVVLLQATSASGPGAIIGAARAPGP